MILKALPLAFVVMVSVSGAAWAQGPKYEVSRIEARLYFEGSGEIGTVNLLDGKAHGLWNTIIGEAGRPSSVTWVLVELTGPTFVSAPRRLMVTAKTKKKALLSQTVTLASYFNEGGRLMLPFLVHGTGCGTLVISATLVDLPTARSASTTARGSVPFECGE